REPGGAAPRPARGWAGRRTAPPPSASPGRRSTCRRTAPGSAARAPCTAPAAAAAGTSPRRRRRPAATGAPPPPVRASRAASAARPPPPTRAPAPPPATSPAAPTPPAPAPRRACTARTAGPPLGARPEARLKARPGARPATPPGAGPGTRPGTWSGTQPGALPGPPPPSPSPPPWPSLRSQRLLVDPVRLVHLPADPLDPPPHVPVVLEDPRAFALHVPQLNCLLPDPHDHHRVQPTVPVARPNAQRQHARRVDLPAVPQELEQAERQQPPVQPLQHLVIVRQRQREAHRLPVHLRDHAQARL